MSDKSRRAFRDVLSAIGDLENLIDDLEGEIAELRGEIVRLENENDHLNNRIDSFLDMEKEIAVPRRRNQGVLGGVRT